MAEKYQCAICRGIFEKVVSEDKALTELHEQFGKGIAVEDCAIICDDCWQKIKPGNPNNKKLFKI